MMNLTKVKETMTESATLSIKRKAASHQALSTRLPVNACHVSPAGMSATTAMPSDQQLKKDGGSHLKRR